MPWAISRMVSYIDRRYGAPEVWVLENGVSEKGEAARKGAAALSDPLRTRFFHGCAHVGIWWGGLLLLLLLLLGGRQQGGKGRKKGAAEPYEAVKQRGWRRHQRGESLLLARASQHIVTRTAHIHKRHNTTQHKQLHRRGLQGAQGRRQGHDVHRVGADRQLGVARGLLDALRPRARRLWRPEAAARAQGQRALPRKARVRALEPPVVVVAAVAGGRAAAAAAD